MPRVKGGQKPIIDIKSIKLAKGYRERKSSF